jgi:hypothetical protein
MSELITYCVEGLDSEHGHVSVAEFLDKINHLLCALNGIDRVVGQSATPNLYYQIVNASHSSPLTITLQPVIKKRDKQNVRTVSASYIGVCHKRFFQELEAVRKMEPISLEIEPELLEHFRDIALGVGQDFKSATIYNGEHRVELDRIFEKNASRLTSEDSVSFGNFEGKLDAVNIHGEARRFWIYPTRGPKKVKCDFMPGTAEQIINALGHFVRVKGLKFFRQASPYPFRIKVKEFEVISNAGRVPLMSLRGIAPDATGGLSAVEFVRKTRDEWD